MNSIGCGFNVYVYWLKTCKCTVCVCLCVTIHCSFSPHKTRKNMHTQILCALCKWRQQKQNERGIRSLDFGCCSVRKGVDQKTSVLLQISREQNIICLWFVCYAILAGWLVVWQVTMHLFWSLSLLSIEFTLSIKRFFYPKIWIGWLVFFSSFEFCGLIESEIQDECGFCPFGYEIYAFINREEETSIRMIRT